MHKTSVSGLCLPPTTTTTTTSTTTTHTPPSTYVLHRRPTVRRVEQIFCSLLWTNSSYIHTYVCSSRDMARTNYKKTTCQGSRRQKLFLQHRTSSTGQKWNFLRGNKQDIQKCYYNRHSICVSIYANDAKLKHELSIIEP